MLRSSIPGIEEWASAVQHDQCLVYDMRKHVVNVGQVGVGQVTFIVSQDGPVEIFDVMCSREDVTVEIFDRGTNRWAARCSGPWLRRREVALVEVLQILHDQLEEHQAKHHPMRAVDVMRQVIQDMPSTLAQSIVFAPNTAYRFDVTPHTNEAAADRQLMVWTRAVQWRHRL